MVIQYHRSDFILRKIFIYVQAPIEVMVDPKETAKLEFKRFRDLGMGVKQMVNITRDPNLMQNLIDIVVMMNEEIETLKEKLIILETQSVVPK
ncbi:MAG: hypothetical protein GPJ54_02350 [Candidatus Heimdallarchaeota archaeon]|nr:hypothetical protein [Candidatus Heimdallarchaeota archaeon]